MSEWKKYKLGDIIRVKHGFAFKGEFFTDTPTNNILLTPGNFKIGGGFKSDKLKYYNGESPTDYILNEGDILISMTDLSKEGDTLGYSAKIPPHTEVKYLHNQRLGLVEFKNDCIDKDFLYWILRTEYYHYYIVGSATGSTVKHTSPSRICDYEFFAPNDKREQNQIAQVLTSLDDKIELLQQMNQTLETIAHTIFKEWFVNFNFPGFDGKLIDGLPKGWKEKSINDICEVTDYVANGSFASLAENVQYKNEPDYAILIRLTDYNRGFNGDFVYVNKDAYEFLNKSKLFGDEIIIANVGANAGDIFRVPFLNKPMTLGPNAIMIKKNDFSHFLYSYLISSYGQHSIKSIIAGSAQPKFNKTDFRKLKIIIPDKNTLLLFNKTYEALNNKLIQNKKDIQSLLQTRDSLLPKLMSGQIEIKN